MGNGPFFASAFEQMWDQHDQIKTTSSFSTTQNTQIEFPWTIKLLTVTGYDDDDDDDYDDDD